MAVLEEIMTHGEARLYTDNPGESAPVRECLGLTLSARDMSLPDPIIQRYGKPEEYAWMEDNFTRQGTVEALNGARSYASRIYRYMDQKDQLAWVVERLRAERDLRSASITMLEPLTDAWYIPCVSLLDFQAVEGRVDLYAYCRALDFGTKAYVNIVMLYRLMEQVAGQVGLPCGNLELMIKSAHVYDREAERVRQILEDYRQRQAGTFWQGVPSKETSPGKRPEST